MSFDWYPFNPTEHRRDTYHLGVAADGIYRRLIDEYMTTGKPLPDHDAALAGIARVTMTEWGEHRDIIRAFFKAREGKLFQKRCEQELHAQRMLAAKRSRRGKEAATVRWAKDKQTQRGKCDEHAGSNANAMLQDATLQDKSISLTTTEVGERPKTAEKEKNLAPSAELIQLVAKHSQVEKVCKREKNT